MNINNLVISVQGINSNKVIFEIITQCRIHKIFIHMQIKLEDNNILNIQFYT